MPFGFIGRALRGVGNVAQGLAPIAGLVPGVGTLASAGLGIGGGLLAGGGGEKGGAGELTRGGGGGGPGGILGGIGGALGSLGLSPTDIAQLGLGGLGVIQGAREQGRAGEIENELLKRLQGEGGAREDIRKRFLSSLDAPIPERGDLSSMFASSNPFSQNFIAPAENNRSVSSALNALAGGPGETGGLPADIPPEALPPVNGRIGQPPPSPPPTLPPPGGQGPRTIAGFTPAEFRPDEDLNAFQLNQRRQAAQEDLRRRVRNNIRGPTTNVARAV